MEPICIWRRRRQQQQQWWRDWALSLLAFGDEQVQ
jgi:hypothetical protein